MGSEKSISILFDPEDMKELREFMRWRMNKNFVSIDSSFDLRDAAGLIKRAQQEKQNILRQIEAERGSQEVLAQQRENVSLLPDREAERIQSEWIKDAEASALRYCQSRNAGATPKAFDPNDKEQADIRSGVLSWLKKQRARGHYPKKVS